MAQAQRIKGQDVEILIVQNGVALDSANNSVRDIRNFDVTPKFEKLEEQYLGETSKRYDEIFHGVDFKMDLHFENPYVLTLIKAIKERAQRRTAGEVINIKATLNFPNGQSPTVILKDCFFEDMPINFGGRSEYGQFTLSGSCTDISTIG